MSTASSQPLFPERFRVLETAGRGGMATVYRALDQQTEEVVALKILHDEGDASERRFLREAELLAQLRHPRIVGYVDHGTGPAGTPYLAMQWLEGQDLEERLAAGPMSMLEALTVAHHAAEALAVAHARGVVHRDVKPSNLFLQGGRVSGLTVLDFGIARKTFDRTLAQTKTGVIVGTAFYMAPEQAHGARELTPAADVFSLGCVLFQCLTGRPPFVAEQLVAVLASIIFDEAPLLRSVRPDLPVAVEHVMARLLAKKPEERAKDGAEVLALLGPLLALPDVSPRTEPGAPTKTLRLNAEQQLLSVIVARPPEAPITADELTVEHASLASSVEIHGGAVELLADGSLVASVRGDGRGVATDQAAQAARIALIVRERRPDAAVVLTTGLGIVTGRLPMGEAIDRAAQLLRDLAADDVQAGVIVDEVTAGLLERRFDVAPLKTGLFLLRGERRTADDLRPLLGKPTPCVGRDQELGALDAMLAAAIDESRSNAVVLAGSAGIGKSRLKHEFLRRTAASHDDVRVIVGRADRSVSGTSGALLRDAVRGLFGLRDDEPREEQRRKLEAEVRAIVPGETMRVAAFLGELASVPFPDDASPRLAQARRDPRASIEEMGRAFVDWLRAEVERHPVTLVLEDLHWADSVSVRLVERALVELEDSPLFVVGLARPEVHETWPDLWAGRVQKIQLRPLSRKACETLVAEVLGAETPRAVIERVVRQSTGNALFLEELMRAVADGKGDEGPDTVLAMLQSRIARLRTDARRVLRACSVFGESFDRAGLATVVPDLDAGAIDDCLTELQRAEILENPRSDGTQSFRHALMRDAAYGLFADDDRRAAHERAGAHLAGISGVDPVVIAEHYRQAGHPERAVPLFMRAGVEANRLGGLLEARQHYGDAYRLIADLANDTATLRLKSDLLLAQAEMGMLADGPGRSLERIDEALGILDRLDADGHGELADRRRRANADFVCARIHHYVGNIAEPIAHAERAIVAARHLGDDFLEAMATQTIGVVQFMNGEATKAEPNLARGVAFLDGVNSEYERLRILGNHAMCLVMLGRVPEGYAAHARSLAGAHESSHASALSVSLAMRVFSDHLCGDYFSLGNVSSVALDYSAKSGEKVLRYMMLYLRGWGQALSGWPDDASELIAAGKKLAGELGGRLFYADWFAAGEAEMALVAGDVDGAIARASALVPELRASGRFLGLGVAEQTWGLALAKTDWSAGEAHLEAARRVYEETGQAMALAKLRLAWAEHLRRRGEGERSTAMRDLAVAAYERGGRGQLVSEVEAAVCYLRGSRFRPMLAGECRPADRPRSSRR